MLIYKTGKNKSCVNEGIFHAYTLQTWEIY